MPPTPSARSTPSGTKMDDGYQSLVAFAADLDASFWEKTVKAPGMDGGGPVDTTTMHNVTWRSFAPKSLITLTQFQVTGAYDPIVYSSLLNLINVKTTVTVHFPNGGSLAFFGFITGVDMNALAEGTQPEISVSVMPGNENPTTGAFEAPVYTEPAS